MATGRLPYDVADEVRLSLADGELTGQIAMSSTARPDDFVVTVYGTRATLRIDLQSMLLDLARLGLGPRSSARASRVIGSGTRMVTQTARNARSIATRLELPPGTPLHSSERTMRRSQQGERAAGATFPGTSDHRDHAHRLADAAIRRVRPRGSSGERWYAGTKAATGFFSRARMFGQLSITPEEISAIRHESTRRSCRSHIGVSTCVRSCPGDIWSLWTFDRAGRGLFRLQPRSCRRIQRDSVVRAEEGIGAGPTGTFRSKIGPLTGAVVFETAKG